MTGHLSVQDDGYTRHKDVGDPDRVPVRIVEGGPIADGIEVEHHDVGAVALLDQAAVVEPEDAGGQRGHLADEERQSDDLPIDHVAAQDTRERAVGARVCVVAGSAAVGGRRDVVARQVMLDKSLRE